MTVGDWLSARTDAPPPALAARLREILADSLDQPAGRVPEACLAAAEATLATLLHGRRFARDGALDLLAADALMTYAFEASGELDPSADALEAFARRAGQRVGHLTTGN